MSQFPHVNPSSPQNTPQSLPAAVMDAESVGRKMAARIFRDRKGHGGAPASEVHLKEDQLALFLAAAFELGVEAARGAITKTTGVA
jgi:hypothetical protein